MVTQPSPRILSRIALAGLGTFLAAQEQPPASPLQALEELASKSCQPRPGMGVPHKAQAHLERFHAQLGPWVLGRLASLSDGTTAELGQRLARELEHLTVPSENSLEGLRLLSVQRTPRP